MEKQQSPARVPAKARAVRRMGGAASVLALGMVAAMPAMAQTAPDVSAATDGLTAVATAVNDIGPLMLTAVGAGIVFKWILGFLI